MDPEEALFNRHMWRVVLVLSALTLIAFADLIQQSIGDMPFYWAPIIIGAAYIRWRSTLVLSAVALLLSVLAGWRWGHMTSPDYVERLTIGVILSIIAVVMAKQIEQRDRRIHTASFIDPLTGLANRTLFYERLGSRLRQRTHTNPTVVIFIDLDSFKHVNDHYGHGIGDAMLKDVGSRLSHVVRDEDTVARLGGDEFVIMCTSIVDAAGAHVLSQRLASALAKPFHLDGHDVIGGGSVGCVVFGGGQISPEELVRLADDALRETKTNEKGGYRLIDLTCDSVQGPNCIAARPGILI